MCCHVFIQIDTFFRMTNKTMSTNMAMATLSKTKMTKQVWDMVEDGGRGRGASIVAGEETQKRGRRRGRGRGEEGVLL